MQDMGKGPLKRGFFKLSKRYLRSVKLCGWIGMDQMMLAGEDQKWSFNSCMGNLQKFLLYVSKGLHVLKQRFCKLTEEKLSEDSLIHLWPRKLQSHKGLENGILFRDIVCVALILDVSHAPALGSVGAIRCRPLFWSHTMVIFRGWQLNRYGWYCWLLFKVCF